MSVRRSFGSQRRTPCAWDVVCLVALVSCAPVAFGAETLDQAWSEALVHDQSLAAARLTTEATRFEAQSARSLRRPTVRTEAAFVQLNDAPSVRIPNLGIPLQFPELVSGDNFTGADFRASIPLYTGGRISEAVSAADHKIAAAESDQRRAEQDLKLQVANAFVNVLRAKRAVRVADSGAETLGVHVKDVANLFARGVVPRNDVLSAEVALADAVQRQLRARNANDLACAAYNRLLGRPLDAVVDLDEQLPPVGAELQSLSVAELTRRAIETRSELRALQAQASALSSLAHVERSSRSPQVALSAGYTHIESAVLDRQGFASVSLGVSWLLNDGGGSKSRASSLERQSRASEARASDARSLIELQVRDAWLNVREATARMDVTERAVEHSEENLKVARDRYREGLGNNTQVLDAETQRVVTLTNRDVAEFDAAFARLQLRRVLEEL